jgi:hypothetical protein
MITRITRAVRGATSTTWGRIALGAAVAALVAVITIPGPPPRVDWLSARAVLTLAFLAVAAVAAVRDAVLGVRRRYQRWRQARSLKLAVNEELAVRADEGQQS